MPRPNDRPRETFAALALPLSSGPASEIQLLPAGTFNAPDGAMMGQGPWHIDRAAAAAVIAKIAGSGNDLAIDYDHQTLMAERNGRPAPAAGWICPHCLQWREGSGLWAVNVRWTDEAAAMIQSGSYRYLSPVFSYNEAGTVTGLSIPAITNNPALRGMPELLAAASRAAFPSPPDRIADGARAEWQGSAALRAEMSQEAYVAFCRAKTGGLIRGSVAGVSPHAALQSRGYTRRLAVEEAADRARSEWRGSAALRAEISLEGYVAYCRAKCQGRGWNPGRR